MKNQQTNKKLKGGKSTLLQKLEIFYLITNIDWDTDGEEIDDLPTELLLSSGRPLMDDDISDWLSDGYGWLVNGFSYEENIEIHYF